MNINSTIEENLLAKLDKDPFVISYATSPVSISLAFECLPVGLFTQCALRYMNVLALLLLLYFLLLLFIIFFFTEMII